MMTKFERDIKPAIMALIFNHHRVWAFKFTEAGFHHRCESTGRLGERIHITPENVGEVIKLIKGE